MTENNLSNKSMQNILMLNLFYENYNAINQHYQKQIHLLSFFLLILLNIFGKEI